MSAASLAAEVRLLEFRARVRAPAAVLRALPAIFPPPPAWTLTGGVAAEATFDVRMDPTQPGTYRIAREGAAWTALADVLPALEWHINSAAVAALSDRYLFLHAGALACHGQGIILPAAPGSGKTTLTAAAVAMGFQYLSDEVAALPLGGSDLVPFAKSLFVKQGSQLLLAFFCPELTVTPPHYRLSGEPVWYLPPPPAAWPAAPVPLRHVVFPRYVPGAPAELTPLSRPDALPLLLRQSFNVPALGTRGVEGIVALLRAAECHTLTLDELAPAVALLLRLLET